MCCVAILQEGDMPHSFSNNERIRREIQALVDKKRAELEQAEQPPDKSEDQPRKGSKKKQKRTR